MAALVAALVLPRPAAVAFPFIVASAIIHIVYFMLVGQLYRSADLSVAYPIMRGLAPLIATVIALATLGEAPGPIATLGVAVLVAGVLAMGASGFAAWANQSADDPCRAGQFRRHRDLFGDRRARREDLGRRRGVRLRVPTDRSFEALKVDGVATAEAVAQPHAPSRPHKGRGSADGDPDRPMERQPLA